jgi:sec-independent protein translocase protein TatB
MLEVGWSEILVIAIVMIVVVGPKDLPRMLRTFGTVARKMRGMASDFQSQFNDALRDAELDDVRKSLNDVRGLDPRNAIKDALNPLRQAGEDVRRELLDAERDLKAKADAQPPIAPPAPPAPVRVEVPQPNVTLPASQPAELAPVLAAKPARKAKPKADALAQVAVEPAKPARKRAPKGSAA